MTPLYISMVSVFIGIASGVVFFWLLKINTNLYLRDEKTGIAAIIHLARFTIIVFIFWYISNFGAVPLLLSLGGFLIGRIVSMKYLMREEL